MTEETMKDISHTPPYGTAATGVWERGNEYDAEQSETDADATTPTAGETPAPADD